MKLEHYLTKTRRECPAKKFIKKINISLMTLWKIQNGGDMKLTLAYKIVEASNGEVTLDDLHAAIRKKD